MVTGSYACSWNTSSPWRALRKCEGGYPVVYAGLAERGIIYAVSRGQARHRPPQRQSRGETLGQPDNRAGEQLTAALPKAVAAAAAQRQQTDGRLRRGKRRAPSTRAAYRAPTIDAEKSGLRGSRENAREWRERSETSVSGAGVRSTFSRRASETIESELLGGKISLARRNC